MYTKHTFKDVDDSMKTTLHDLKYSNLYSVVTAENFVQSNVSILGTPISADVINEIENKIVELENELFHKKRMIYYRSDDTKFDDARLDFLQLNNVYIGDAWDVTGQIIRPEETTDDTTTSTDEDDEEE